MELLQLFDNDKNKVDEYIERNKNLELPPNRRIKAVLLFIQNEEGKYLIQKTSKEKGSIFAVTGGLVSSGDDDIETVFKEAKEELSLDLIDTKLTLVDYSIYPKAFLTIYYYKDNIDINNLILQKEEVDYVTWLTKEEIYDLNNKHEFRESNIPAFEIVLNWLDNNKKID